MQHVMRRLLRCSGKCSCKPRAPCTRRWRASAPRPSGALLTPRRCERGNWALGLTSSTDGNVEAKWRCSGTRRPKAERRRYLRLPQTVCSEGAVQHDAMRSRVFRTGDASVATSGACTERKTGPARSRAARTRPACRHNYMFGCEGRAGIAPSRSQDLPSGPQR